MNEEEKQIMNKMIYCNLINGEQALKFNRHIKEIQEENELLHSIIKEAREYIENCLHNLEGTNDSELKHCIETIHKYLLEILDKGE